VGSVVVGRWWFVVVAVVGSVGSVLFVVGRWVVVVVVVGGRVVGVVVGGVGVVGGVAVLVSSD
jgi:hypothetical protein